MLTCGVCLSLKYISNDHFLPRAQYCHCILSVCLYLTLTSSGVVNLCLEGTPPLSSPSLSLEVGSL